MEEWFNKIHIGDCYKLLKELPENSIDCVVTDPPYAINFMGKDWDKVVVSVDVWRECLRVLKDGAFMFVMSAPRQDVLSQMIVRLGQAGFNTGFTSIYWTYASGFPKAMNISKAIDKKLNIKREVIGKEKIDIGIQSGSMHSGRNSEVIERDKTIATSKEAKVLDGSYGGFQPKPAVEIIIVCMKPLSEKTYVEQALKNGKGVTWLDNVRIPFEENPTGVWGTSNKTCKPTFNASVDQHDFRSSPHRNGRFPANLLVSDDSLNNGTIHKSGDLLPHHKLSKDEKGNQIKSVYGNYKRLEENRLGDEGSFSRYFDLDKWFSEQIKKLPKEIQKTFPFLICPKASKSERNKGCEDLELKRKSHITSQNMENALTGSGNPRNPYHKNFHPTVKPIKLMSYLITLGSRENNIVLDPFVGSGTTCIAAQILNRKWIGIEINPEYALIARERLNPYMKIKQLTDFQENG